MEKNIYEITSHKSLRPQYLPFGRPNYGEEEINSVSETLRSGWVGMGNQTLRFEEELAKYVGSPFVSTVNSCTSALFLALLIHNVKKNDEIICPSLTWCSSANAALFHGAKVVFSDVDPDTFSVNTETILKSVTPKTRAVIIVHYGGYAVDVKEIREQLPKRIKIVEDAAHALGSLYPDSTPVGSSGNLTCYSFYANKNLSTGDGGAIALFDEEQNEKIKSLRQHSMNANAWNRFVSPKSILYSEINTLGFKMNYTDLQASIGRVQLQRQAEFKEVRSLIANYYFNELKDLQPEIKFQKNVTDVKHAKHLFAITIPTERMKITRNDFVLKLREQNIGASIHYYPLHMMPLYSYKGPKLTQTEKIAESVLTLPISASMTLEDAEYVVDKFKEIFNKNITHRLVKVAEW